MVVDELNESAHTEQEIAAQHAELTTGCATNRDDSRRPDDVSAATAAAALYDQLDPRAQLTDWMLTREIVLTMVLRLFIGVCSRSIHASAQPVVCSDPTCNCYCTRDLPCV